MPSILGVLSLGLEPGDTLILITEGGQAAEALSALQDVMMKEALGELRSKVSFCTEYLFVGVRVPAPAGILNTSFFVKYYIPGFWEMCYCREESVITELPVREHF